MHTHREAEKLLHIQNAGWSSVGTTPVIPNFQPQPATLNTLPSRGQYTELEILQLLLPDSLVEEAIVQSVNENLFLRQQEVADHSKKRYNPIDVPTWWCFYAKYTISNLFSVGLDKKEAKQWLKMEENLMGNHRYSAVFSAHTFNKVQLQKLQNAIQQQIASVFKFGNMQTVDESVYSYRGDDARDEGIDINIERKPHPYGVMAYVLAQKLLWSQLPIAVAFELRTPWNKPSAQKAAMRLIEYAQFVSKIPAHTIADSAFIASKSLQEIKGLDKAMISVAISASSSCGMSDLYNLISQSLHQGNTRTLSSPIALIQAKWNEDHITAVATNAWKVMASPVNNVFVTNEPKIQYDTAVLLFERESLAAIKHLCKLDNSVPVSDPVQVMLAATGWNILLPPPDAFGKQQLTASGLNQMKLSQLRLLHQQTRGCSGSSKKSLATIKADLIKHHPDLQQQQPGQQQRKASEVDPKALTASILGDVSDSAPIIDHYSANYNLIDRLDRHYYKAFNPAYHRDWSKLFVMSLLFTTIQNARAAFEEHRRVYLYSVSRGNKAQAANLNSAKFKTYLLSLIEQLVKKYRK